jgi:hypothetical protein
MVARNEPPNDGAFADAAARTLRAADGLGLLWGPSARAAVTVYGVSHDDLHALDGHLLLLREGDGPALVCALVETGLGWCVAFYGHADEACRRCREIVAESDAEEPAASGEHEV